MSDMIALLTRAQEIVRNKRLWKRFIDGTPLSNDIAVWMAEFAQAELADLERRLEQLAVYKDAVESIAIAAYTQSDEALRETIARFVKDHPPEEK